MPAITPEQYAQLRTSGLDEPTIKSLAESRGYSLPDQDGVITDFVQGLAKGFVKDVARPLPQALQGIGQRAIALATPLSLEQVRSQTGFKSLDDSTPEGQAVLSSLQSRSGAESAGRVVANIASFFLPVSKPIQVAGRVTSGLGKLSARAGIGLSSKEAPLMQAYKAKYPTAQRILAALRGKTLPGDPITNAETALKLNVFGTESMIGVKAKRAADNIWKGIIAPSLEKSKATVNMREFISELSKQVDEIPELSRRKEVQSALSAFADDYKNVGNISLKKLQQYKEGWARLLPDKVYRGKPIAGSFKEIQRIAASLARNKIYNVLGLEGRAAYFDYGNLKNLQELGQKAMTGSKLKGGAGSFISGLYDKVVTPIATTGGLGLYKVGEGLEFVGGLGAKTLGQLFK